MGKSHNVLKQFKEMGLSFLIPEEFISQDYYPNLCDEDDYYNDDYCCDNTRSMNNRSLEYEPEIDGYNCIGDDYEYGITNEGQEYINLRPAQNITDSNYKTLGDLKFALEYDYLSDYDFLHLTAEQIFGVTNAQMKFFDVDILSAQDVGTIIHMIKDEAIIAKIPDIQQRIKYCQILDYSGISKTYPTTFSITDFDYVEFSNYFETMYSKEAVDKYITKIILNQGSSKALMLLSLYKDYIKFFFAALYMDKLRENNNEPIFKYTINPKISHLKDLHDKASRDYTTLYSKIEALNVTHVNEKIKYRYTMDFAYTQFLYKNHEFSIIAPKDINDFRKEGKTLNHCVESYISPHADSETNIYFLRKTKNLDEPYYTLEVLFNEPKGYYYLHQCYTYNDTVDNDTIRKDFIIKWCKEKKIMIKCKI